MTFDPGNRLIAALDVPIGKQALELIRRMGNHPSFYKVGLELFCGDGPDFVRRLACLGYRLMLDLHLHDIPATVGQTVERLAALGVELLTVHTEGGLAMLSAAVKAAGRTRILATTLLTSLDEVDMLDTGAVGPASQLIMKRARLAYLAGCAGVVTPVATPYELASIRAVTSPDFLLVAPGIRSWRGEAGSAGHTMTARETRKAGADLVVIGHQISEATCPDRSALAHIAALA